MYKRMFLATSFIIVNNGKITKFNNGTRQSVVEQYSAEYYTAINIVILLYIN